MSQYENQTARIAGGGSWIGFTITEQLGEVGFKGWVLNRDGRMAKKKQMHLPERSIKRRVFKWIFQIKRKEPGADELFADNFKFKNHSLLNY